MKISVIVPVYNSEKFLPVCLESLAIQTLRDFEVIVVDDCSTDSSLAVAESFVERFDGRLKIFTLSANTGSGAVPRNVGLERACGDYVYFVDDDDLLIDNALETLYNFAEEYRADVVYMDCGFICGAEPVPAKITIAAWDANNIVEVPTLETDEIAKRVQKFLDCQYRWPPWGKFLRRDFLIDNNIEFPRMVISEDIPWTFNLVCLAKKILRVPTPCYVQRNNNESMTRRTRSPESEIVFWINPLLTGVEYLNEFMNRREFFQLNPDARLQVLNLFVNIQFQHMTNALEESSVTEVYEIFLREFTAAGNPQAALTAYLLLMNNIYRNELIK